MNDVIIIGVDPPQGIAIWMPGCSIVRETKTIDELCGHITTARRMFPRAQGLVVVEAPFGRKTDHDNKDSLLKNAIAHGRVVERAIVEGFEFGAPTANEWRAPLGLNRNSTDRSKEAAGIMSDALRKFLDLELIRGPKGGGMFHAREAECMAIYGATRRTEWETPLLRFYESINHVANRRR